MIYIATDNYKDGFPLSKAYDDTIYQKGNGEYYLKFRFPVDRLGVWKHLTCETILKADDTRGLQLFKIKKINKINGYIRVYCKHISDDLNYIGVDKLSVTNATGRRVMEALAGSTTEQHNFIFNSDIATMHTLNLSNTTAGKILSKDKHSIIGQWGGELVRDNFLVDLKVRAGVDTEILFMNKKNVKNLDNAISTENLTTRLKLSVEKEHEGKKQTITATVDSPNINAYPRIYTNYLKVTNNNITTQEELIEYGKKYFRDKLVDFPTDNLTVNVIDKNQEQVKLFDTVWFRNVDFNIDKRLKVVAYEYSPMAKRYKKISFGALKVSNLSQIKSLSQLEDKIEEKVNESFVDAFKIQKNLSELLKSDRKGIEDKLVELEEKSKGALEVKKALFEADGTIPDVVKAKILDAVEGDIGRLKTIITEAELIKAIQAKLNYAEIKNALIDKAFINQIISDEKFTQQFEEGQVTTQNIFTKLKDSIKSNISKEFVTKDGVRKLVNDLTIDADGIRQITQQESQKVFNTSITGKVQEIVGEVKKNLPTKEELKGKNSYLHKKYSDYADGRNMSDNSTLKYIGIYTGDKQQAPTNASEYSWTKIKSDGKLYKAYSNSLNGLDFTLVEPDENAKLFAKNRPRVNIANNNDISDIWQANMFLSFKPNTKYTLTARAKGNSNKLWAYFRNNKTNAQFNWGQLEFRGLETKSITFTTTNDVEDVLFKFVLVPEDEDWTGIQIDWFTIYEGDKRYTDYPVNEPAQYHKYRYFGYVFKESTPVASDFEWFDLQQTSITNDKYTHIVYSDNADGSNFGREPKKYMGVARTTSPTQPTDKTAYKWFKMKGEDGVSSYIHRKYSDYSNGANMSDNSNLKYIGIYTGTSQTPPTTASAYLWSKIKGEDGANGVPGAKGADGRTPYFHTAYSNSPTGDRDFSTTNSTGKEYIGTYSDFEVADSTDFRKYKWVKIKGENGERGRDGVDGKSINRNYIVDSEKLLSKQHWGSNKWDETVEDNTVILTKKDGSDRTGFWFAFTDVVKNQFQNETLTWSIDIKANRNMSLNKVGFETNGQRKIDITTNWTRISHTFVNRFNKYNAFTFYEPTTNFNNGDKIYIRLPKLETGNVATEWTPAYEDLQAHSLTANLRFEGRYINSITTDVKAYLDVFYDGQKVDNGFEVKLKDKGGTRTDWSDFWNSNVNDGLLSINNSWKNGNQNGQPLELIALVTYKDLNTVTNARMENIPDIVEIKEITKKYKTFESTIDQFNSTIGEVKQQVLANEEKRNLIIGSRLLNDSDYKVFGKAITNGSSQGVYAQVRQNTNDLVSSLYNGNSYLYVLAMNNTQPSWQGVGFKLSTNYMYYGSKYSLRIPCLILREATLDKGIYMEIKNHNTGKVIWRYRLDKQTFPAGEFDTIKGVWIERTATFQLERAEPLSDYSFWIYAVQNGGFCISAPYMCEGDVLPKAYSPAPEDVHLQNSRIESSIKQTKDEIDLKVSKDNVIAAINASVETTGEGPAQGVVKIDADKVDIRGALRAYKGYIGGFQIGTHEKDPNKFWLTGTNQFYVGMSNGGGNWGQTALWVNWGTEWGSPGNHAWFVKEDGRMFCYNKAEFWSTPIIHGDLQVTGNIVYKNGKWCYSPIYTEISKSGNRLTLRGNNGAYDYINIDSLVSDRRLKSNIKKSTINALEVLNKLETYSFTRKYREDVKDIELGIMAQDIKKYMPDAFVDHPGGYYTYEPFEMQPYLIKAIQELSTENQQLKSQITEMNERLTKLEDKINGNI